jgi:SRSO17 transposase
MNSRTPKETFMPDSGNLPYDIPKYHLEKTWSFEFTDLIQGFIEQFEPCFYRKEPKANFGRYIIGQLSELNKKSIKPIAKSLSDAKVRAMQFFLSDVQWDAQKIVSKYHSMIFDDLGDPHGVLILGDKAFTKKGIHSAGVARQISLDSGNNENCQIGIFGVYASRYGYCLMDNRLFVPIEWFGDKYAKRREKCKFPGGLTFKTKPELAADIVKSCFDHGTLAVKLVVADTIWEDVFDLVNVINAMPDIRYFVPVLPTTPCWLKNPITVTKEYAYGGKKRSKLVALDPGGSPVSCETIAKTINDYFWYKRKVNRGHDGSTNYEFAKLRISLAKDVFETEAWLVIRRTLRKESLSYSYYLSNSPGSTRIETFAWLSGLRWITDQCFKECNSILGLDQYEVRKYPGWTHHMIAGMLGHFFLLHLKHRADEKAVTHYSIYDPPKPPPVENIKPTTKSRSRSW